LLHQVEDGAVCRALERVSPGGNVEGRPELATQLDVAVCVAAEADERFAIEQGRRASLCARVHVKAAFELEIGPRPFAQGLLAGEAPVRGFGRQGDSG
jgi:hypothetical protein